MREVLRTPLCDLLGIEYPIVLAGMGSFGTCTPPALVAAVSEAGGLGVIGATGLPAETLRDWIREVRTLTTKPFGVDLLLPKSTVPIETLVRSQLRNQIPDLYPKHWAFAKEIMRKYGLEELPLGDDLGVLAIESSRALADVVLEEKVPVFAAALSAPDWFVPAAHEQGMTVMGLAGNVRHAQKHREASVDVIIATGTEAGGHTGKIGTMPLIPQVVDEMAPLPVLAAGGIGNGRQVAAALALGAQGVWVGSAFLFAHECGIEPEIKDLMVDAGPEDFALHTLYTGKSMRGMANEVTRAWVEGGLEPMPVVYQKLMMDDFQNAAKQAQLFNLTANPGGQIAGTIKERKPAAQIVNEMVEEAAETILHLTRNVVGRSSVS